MSTAQPPRKTPVVLVILAWTLVAIPLAWGLYQSVIKSKPLFSGAAAAGVPSTPAPVSPSPSAPPH